MLRRLPLVADHKLVAKPTGATSPITAGWAVIVMTIMDVAYEYAANVELVGTVHPNCNVDTTVTPVTACISGVTTARLPAAYVPAHDEVTRNLPLAVAGKTYRPFVPENGSKDPVIVWVP